MMLPTTAREPLQDRESSLDLEQLAKLPQLLLQSVSTATSRTSLLKEIAALLPQIAPALAISYFHRNPQGQLAESLAWAPAPPDRRGERLGKQLAAVCQTACRKGDVVTQRQAVPPRLIVGLPIARKGMDPEALGIVFAAEQPPPQLALLAQLVASHLVIWESLQHGRTREGDARQTAALLELLERMATAPDVRRAGACLSGELQAYLGCDRVALGLRRGGKGRCRLSAISGMAQFDRRAAAAHALEAAFDEAVLRNELISWPSSGGDQRPAALVHKTLCAQDEMKLAVSTPLHQADGSIIGVLTLSYESSDRLDEAERFLRLAEQSLGAWLGRTLSLEGGRLMSFGRTVKRWASAGRAGIALAAVGLASLAMLLPLPYRIACDCQVEPVTRRYVPAPFEGTLEKSFAQPGDVVASGALLARLDGREIRWKRAGLAANRNQAVKQRDAARAAHHYAESQIAQLEMERLDLELQLLDYRAENLEIRSPLAGVVVSGDMERVEGAPLTPGQTLFEIAPLEKILVEIAVPDQEISHVHEGQPVEVRLNAYPGENWQAPLTRVQPRSEARDENNVFIACIELDNTHDRLRPGMKGRAKIAASRRTLGWILFRKPWEYLSKKLSW